MVVKHVFPSGSRLHGPPYTKAKEDEFYKMIGGGPTTVARGAGDRKSRRPQNSSSRRRQNRTALKSLLEPLDPTFALADNPARVLDVLVRRAALR